MSPVLALIVLLSFYENKTAAETSSCDIKCDSLPLVPPRWGHNGKEVRNIALMCVVQSECHLDIYDILSDNTTQDAKEFDTEYISVDLYFTCRYQSLLGEYTVMCLC